MSNQFPDQITAPSAGNELCYECDGARICIFCRGRGTLINGNRCGTCHGDGKCIICNGVGELPEGTGRAARAASHRPDKSRRLVEIQAADLKERGFRPLTIRVDAASAGMSERLFPAKDTILALNGPPGGPLVLVLWDCTQLSANVAEAIQARLVPTWTKALELRHRDKGMVMGEEREGMTFFTGAGRARIAWFGVLVRVRDARLLLACGVPGSAPEDVPAADVLSHPSIKSAVESLEIS